MPTESSIDLNDTKDDEEAKRLAVIRRYDILDTPPDGSFDHITAIAAQLFEVPISIISIVDNDRIWFKSHHGLDVDQIGRDPGLCASAILKNEPYILPDAKLDPHALSNPLVAGDFGLRFYAGIPLHTHDGFNLGTLCIIDREPREVSPERVHILEDLAAVVMDQLELRIAARNSLAIKEDLIKEIYHRVGNSLQLISNTLAIQGTQEDSHSAVQFNDAAERVALIGKVHHRLSRTGRLETIEFKQYLTDLCEDIAHSILIENTLALVVEGENIELPVEQATSLGLIVNELVTNSVKYAYPNNASGTITVFIGKADDRFLLSVCDDGIGLPNNSQGQKAGSGTKLITSLVQNINGEMAILNNQNGRGVTSRILFSKKVY